MSIFEINWSTSKIRLPWASVNAYTALWGLGTLKLDLSEEEKYKLKKNKKTMTRFAFKPIKLLLALRLQMSSNVSTSVFKREIASEVFDFMSVNWKDVYLFQS